MVCKTNPTFQIYLKHCHICNHFFYQLSEKIHFTGRKNTQHLSMTNTVEGERKQARNLCNVMAWLHALKDVIWEKFNALPF